MVLLDISEKIKNRDKNVYKETYPWRDGIIQYTIDKNKGKVTCVFIPDDYDEDTHTADKLLRKLPFMSTCFCDIDGIWTKKAVGVAKCNSEDRDKFNPKIGKRIAFVKMRRQYHSRVMQIYYDLLKDMDLKRNMIESLIKNEKATLKKMSDDLNDRIESL